MVCRSFTRSASIIPQTDSMQNPCRTAPLEIRFRNLCGVAASSINFATRPDLCPRLPPPQALTRLWLRRWWKSQNYMQVTQSLRDTHERLHNCRCWRWADRHIRLMTSRCTEASIQHRVEVRMTLHKSTCKCRDKCFRIVVRNLQTIIKSQEKKDIQNRNVRSRSVH